MSSSSLPTTNDFLDKYQPSSAEMRRERARRVVAGVVYGLVLGVVYALVSGTIDVISYPDLPLRVAWNRVGTDLLFTGLGGMVLGAVAAWPGNSWVGTLAGAGAIVTWEMARALLRLSNLLSVFLLIFVLPLVVLSLPIAAVFRWSVSRHIRVMQRPRLRRRLVGVTGLVVAVVALAAFAGSWSRMTGSAEVAVRKVNTAIQLMMTKPAKERPRAFSDITDFPAPSGHKYWLSYSASAASPTGIEVHITFDNGYVVTCYVETETGQAQITLCGKGPESPWGPASGSPADQR